MNDITIPKNIEHLDVSVLVPYAQNSRTHSNEQIDQISASIKEFGFTNPILIDENGGIIAGHGRVMAAKSMGLKQVPCLRLAHLSENQKRAYVIADNKLALNAGWDETVLKLELQALMDDGFDLGLTGFSFDEFKDIKSEDESGGLTEADDVPDIPEKPVSKLGDVWQLGGHRVMCGDSTSMAAFSQLMGEDKADIMFTDPPYNVAYNSKLAGSIKNDDMGNDEFKKFLLGFYTCAFNVMKPGASAYIFHADTEGLNFRAAFTEAGFKLSGCLIWQKDSLVLGRSDFQWQHEPCLYGWKPGASHRWFGGRKETTIIKYGNKSPIRKREDGNWVVEVGDSILVVSGDARIEEFPSSVIFHEKPRRSENHPTMKPVTLVEKFLRFSARASDIVIDAFGGSGSTLIAAERSGMKARLMELDDKYVDVIINRWQDFTGKTATLVATGQTFEQVKAERLNG